MGARASLMLRLAWLLLLTPMPPPPGEVTMALPPSCASLSRPGLRNDPPVPPPSRMSNLLGMWVGGRGGIGGGSGSSLIIRAWGDMEGLRASPPAGGRGSLDGGRDILGGGVRNTSSDPGGAGCSSG